MLQLVTVALLWMRLVVTSAQVPWSVRLPITIEVKQDVEFLIWDDKRHEARAHSISPRRRSTRRNFGSDVVSDFK
jgi:hypothetical protein